MSMPSAKIPDNNKDVLDTIKRLESAKVETPHTKDICCAQSILKDATMGLTVMITKMGSAFRQEDQFVKDACKKASDKKKIVELPHPAIAKTKKATDKQEKLLTKAELAHKQATAKLVAAFIGQATHLKCQLKDAKGDHAAEIKGLIAATNASLAKVNQGANDVMVNGKAYRDQVQGDRKSGDKLIKKAEKHQEELKKKQKSKSKK